MWGKHQNILRHILARLLQDMAEAWQNQLCARPDLDKPSSVLVWVLELEILQQGRIFVVPICVSMAGFLLQLQLLPKLQEQMKPCWATVVGHRLLSPRLVSQLASPLFVLLDTNHRLIFPRLKLCIFYFSYTLPWKNSNCHPVVSQRSMGFVVSKSCELTGLCAMSLDHPSPRSQHLLS